MPGLLRTSPHRVHSLRTVLTAALSLLTCIVTLLVAVSVGQSGVRHVELEIGESLVTLANEMQDKLDRGIFERFREVSTAAALFTPLQLTDAPDKRRAWIDRMASSNRDYLWIAHIGSDGRVLEASGGLYEQRDVSARPWFKAALKRPRVGEVHEPVLSQAKAQGQNVAPPLYLDIAAPVLNAEGEAVGVLVAFLNWSWAREIRSSLFGANLTDRADVLVLSREGHVLLGPSDLHGKRLELRGLIAAAKGIKHFTTEVWPDGRSYLTGYARSDGHQSYTGLQWLAIVRQPTEVALAPVRRLQLEIILWSVLLTALAAGAAWLIASRITAPLLRLASAAESTRRGDPTPIPILSSYREVDVLSRSLTRLVRDLKVREASLAELNASLDTLVLERTRELAERNEALTKARDAAERATSEKSRFLAAASHDLRQPLHAMIFFARSLARRTAGEAAVIVSQLEKALGSLKEMLDALLNISRLDSGVVAAERSPVSARELVTRVSSAFQAEAQFRGLRLTSRSVAAVVVTDPAILETALRNLVSNAIKFTSKGGVLIAARRRGGSLAFEVYDTGPGIAPADQSRIFLEYERAKMHAHGSNEGLGLGLAIVERYARLLGGRIDLRSRLHHGSRFSVILPEADCSVAAATKMAPAAREVALAGKRILIVDDEPLILAGLIGDLKDRGSDVCGCGSPEAAEEALAGGFEPDAAVVDFDLRIAESGLMVLRRLEKRLGHPVPCLLLSGRTDAVTMRQIADLGVPWMTKPADAEAIALALSRMCAS